jgi:hypothetical protein
MFLSERSGRRTQPSNYVVKTLLAVAEELPVTAVVVHDGVGFCDYVFKAVSPSYEDTLDIVQHLQDLAANLRLQAWTLVAADYGARSEGETIDALQSVFPRELEPFVVSRADASLVRREIKSLERRQRAALIDIHNEAKEQLTTPEFERFAEVLERSIVGDRKTLNQTLSFLTSIEGDLRYVLPRLLPRHLGASWYSDVIRMWSQFADAGDAETVSLSDYDKRLAKSIDDWSLYQLMIILNRVLKDRPLLEVELEGYLAPDWRKSIRRIVDLRNDYAHSKLVEATRTRDYQGQWGARLRDLMLAIKFQLGVERVREEIMNQVS